MDLHKGRIWVESAGEGHGTTFTVEIPIPSNAELLRLKPKSDVSSRHPHQLRRVFPASNWDLGASAAVVPVDNAVTPFHRLRIMVVDDVLSNRKMLGRLLEDVNDIDMADDGDVAVSRVLEAMGTPNAYDVILMDNQMNRMNGPIAAKTLREKGFVGVIVGVTGNALRQDVEDYLAHGADEVIGKPVDVDFLERRIAGRAILKRWLLCITV